MKPRKPILLTACLSLLLLFTSSLEGRAQERPYRHYLPLAGEWQTELGTITLPGTTDTNRKGTPLVKKDETTHLSRLFSYVGQLTYTRQIEIPVEWKKKNIFLHLERTKPTTIIVDGKTVATCDDISTRQEFDLSRMLSPGKHTLAITVDNTDKGVPSQLLSSSHAYTEDTQTNWNGIIGAMYLMAVDPVYIEQIDVNTDAAKKSFEAIITVNGNIKKKADLEVVLATMGNDYGTVIAETTLKDDKTNHRRVSVKFQNDSLECWDEHHPTVYRLIVKLVDHDMQETLFGLCDFRTKGTQFSVNGHPTFLRGKHDACVFPYTGHVPMDIASWRRYLQICKGYGINHIRFHSWCPPEAAFLAADIEGVYLQPELPFWGDFKKDDNRLMAFLFKEGMNIIRHYGHHPSFVMFALGNELWGDIPSMKRFVDGFRKMAPQKCYTFGSNYYLGYQGWKEGMDYFTTCRNGGERWGDYNTHTRASFSFCDAFDGGIINHFRPNSILNFDEAVSKCPVPIISHETGQFQTYPDFREISKYTGVLYPYNIEVFRSRLEQAGMADQAEAFHRASGKWSVQLYKQDIEMNLRTRGMAGFQLLDIQDYPGQGSAYVGILDAFMEPKGITTPQEWRQWCNDVVPLAVMPKYCYEDGEEIPLKVQVANYGTDTLEGKTLRWNIGQQSGTLPIPTGQGLLDVGTVNVKCSATEAQKLTLTLAIDSTDYRNSWSLWVYPSETKPNLRGITLCHQFTDAILKKLEQGATVLFMPDSTAADSAAINSAAAIQFAAMPSQSLHRFTVGGLFQTDYWNYRMFKTISENNHKPVSPGTLGILTNPQHPVFNAFPTEEHTSWQWFPIVKNAHPFILDRTPAAYRPVVQVIDNVERNHKLGLLFEFKVGKGRLMVCMSPLHQLQQYAEGRQLYVSVLRYMQGQDFAPQTTLSPEELRTLLTTPVEEGELKQLFNTTTY